MPRCNQRPRGNGGTGSCPSRASASFGEAEVAAMLSLFARLDVAPASVRVGGNTEVNKVRAKFIAMGSSIKAAKAAERAKEGEAAQ